MNKRLETYQKRREELARLSDVELKERFWKRAQEIVAPLVTLSETHTSPSIERSVVMRMGFDSITAARLVAIFAEYQLLEYGVGHGLLRYAQANNQSVTQAATQIIAQPDRVKTIQWPQ